MTLLRDGEGEGFWVSGLTTRRALSCGPVVPDHRRATEASGGHEGGHGARIRGLGHGTGIV